MLRPRPQGTVGLVEKPSGALWEEAQRILAAKAKKQEQDRARRAAIPVPNRICYANTAFKDWKPGDRIPPCNKCGGLLHPNENHVCSGFVPKYVEHDADWHERLDAKREAIQETNQRPRGRYCSVCDRLMEDADDEHYHIENCGHEPEISHRALRGDEDDLSGYEDEPEEDCCEGDDDGDDCE